MAKKQLLALTLGLSLATAGAPVTALAYEAPTAIESSAAYSVLDTKSGDVEWNNHSHLDLHVAPASTFAGAFIDTDQDKAEGGFANLTIDEGSSWVVTGNSELSSLTNRGVIFDQEGRSVSVVGTDGNVFVRGNGPVVITVKNYKS